MHSLALFGADFAHYTSDSAASAHGWAVLAVRAAHRLERQLYNCVPTSAGVQTMKKEVLHCVYVLTFEPLFRQQVSARHSRLPNPVVLRAAQR